MPGPQADPAAPRAPGLLKPWALLPRLRPLRLAALARQLEHHQRTLAALRLLQSHFPDALAEYNDLAGTGWWELLAALLNRVEEENWFAVDWDALNDSWAYWMEEPGENGDHLARYLEAIPARYYGFGPEERLHLPPVELLHVLLSPDAEAVSADLLAAAELYDGLEEWTEAERQAAWERLYAIEADPGRCPEPVRWLPELARWACARSGNLLLDQSCDPYRGGPWYSWTADLEQVRAAWRRAEPVISQLERLLAWCETDETNLAILAHILLEDTDYERYDWW